MAFYDVPMIIELMLSETGTKKVFYIGHSMGATFYSIAVAEQPELNEKIHASFSFGGGEFMAHSSTTPAKALFKILDFEPRIQVCLKFIYLIILLNKTDIFSEFN